MSSEKQIDGVSNFEKDKFAMDKYSRQVGEYGVEAMSKLVAMKVLVICLKGIGIECAKNLILAGVGSVTLFDDDEVTISDLGTNFYLTEAHVGKPDISVAQASLQALKSLNSLVNVSLHEGKLTNKHLQTYHVIVDCGLTLAQARVCNKECRKAKNKDGFYTKFIKAYVHGLVGYAFVDFGNEFVVKDKSGEQPVNRIIENIEFDEKSGDTIVRIITEGKLHNIQDDDHEGFIRIEEVEGELGEYLNSTKEPFRVKMNERTTSEGKKVFDPFSLRIKVDYKGAAFPTYEGGGVFNQVKQPVVMKFRSLEENLLNPVDPTEGMLLFTDGAKFGRADQFHIGLNALWRYQEKHKSFPAANNEAAIAEVLAVANDFNLEMKVKSERKESVLFVEKIDEEVIGTLARFAECQFQPLCCFFGGVVAQEVVKLTGKYTPLHQWLHLDCFEVLPEKFVDEKNPAVLKVSKKDRKPIGSRYDDLIKILGLPLHRKLTKSSTFMVGCGALGCELLKNFALIGLSCDAEKVGLITVTDNDRIEISNLSRQFLFREDNVGQSKSLAASASVKKMNPDINVKAMEMLVSPSSETVFNDTFWEKLSFITNALDNVTARLYVDSQCVFYEKPLLESGTLGTKCNSQVIVPFLTQSYEDGPQDEVGDAIPMCTLRNFPSLIEHCIEWARGLFTDLFETESAKAFNFVKEPKEFLKNLKSKTVDLSKNHMLNGVHKEFESVQKVVDILSFALNKNSSFEDCLSEAYVEFHKLFKNKIVSLITAHPENSNDTDGHPFWSAPKRFPLVAEFDINNESHLGFVTSMANILANIYGLASEDKSSWNNATYIRSIVEKFTPPIVELEEVDLSNDVEGETKDKTIIVEGSESTDIIVDKFKRLLAFLEDLAVSDELENIKLDAVSFEKDNDSNFHIDFITAASNMRAWNYKLKPVSRHKCKMIAGKIIPALATTTAAVTGLITVELLKLIQTGKTLEAFKDTSNSLGINQYLISEPLKPAEAKDGTDVMTLEETICLPPKFTKWDKTLIKGNDLTLKQFLDEFNRFGKEKFGKDLVFTMLFHKSSNESGTKGYSKFIYLSEIDLYEDTEYQNKKLKALVEEIYGDVCARNYVRLECNVQGTDGQAYRIPDLIYQFREE